MADDMPSTASVDAIELATELTIAWLNNPNVRANADDVPAFLKTMHATIGELASPSVSTADAVPKAAEHAPAVPVRSSVKPDYLISLIDGRKLKTLKRHLATNGLTPKQYRERYGLKADYPMVASNYAEARRDVAKKIGLGSLGRKAKVASPVEAAPAKAPAAVAKPKKAPPAAAKPEVTKPAAVKRSRQPKPAAVAKNSEATAPKRGRRPKAEQTA